MWDCLPFILVYPVVTAVYVSFKGIKNWLNFKNQSARGECETNLYIFVIQFRNRQSNNYPLFPQCGILISNLSKIHKGFSNVN